jgi:hypothetical protein
MIEVLSHVEQPASSRIAPTHNHVPEQVIFCSGVPLAEAPWGFHEFGQTSLAWQAQSYLWGCIGAWIQPRVGSK